MIEFLISAPVLILVAVWAIVEAFCVLTGRATISRRIQGWVIRNPQLACLVSAFAGWLLAHFTGAPG